MEQVKERRDRWIFPLSLLPGGLTGEKKPKQKRRLSAILCALKEYFLKIEKPSSPWKPLECKQKKRDLGRRRERRFECASRQQPLLRATGASKALCSPSALFLWLSCSFRVPQWVQT